MQIKIKRRSNNYRSQLSLSIEPLSPLNAPSLNNQLTEEKAKQLTSFPEGTAFYLPSLAFFNLIKSTTTHYTAAWPL